MFRRIAATLAVLLVLTAAGCSDDTKDKAKDTVQSAKDDAAETVDQAKARTAAETFRTSLKNNDTAHDDGYRSMDAIEESGADLPAGAEMSGVEDGDGDGLDDDGNVQIDVDDESACVRIPEDGDDIDVEGGTC